MAYTPRILIWDAEVTPTLAWVYDMYDTNVVRKEQEWFFQSFSYKWLGLKPVTKALPDFPGYEPRKHDDELLVRELHAVLSQADVLMGHNVDRFDIRKANARFIYHGLDPIETWKTVDTLKVARSRFAFSGNSLDSLCEFLGLGNKLYHHSDLWYRCYEGDMKAWSLMKRYNAQDVLLTEKLYLRLRPWIRNHPNLNLLTGEELCPACQSARCIKNGTYLMLSGMVMQKYQCLECLFNYRRPEPERMPRVLTRT